MGAAAGGKPRVNTGTAEACGSFLHQPCKVSLSPLQHLGPHTLQFCSVWPFPLKRTLLLAKANTAL